MGSVPVQVACLPEPLPALLSHLESIKELLHLRRSVICAARARSLLLQFPLDLRETCPGGVSRCLQVVLPKYDPNMSELSRFQDHQLTIVHMHGLSPPRPHWDTSV